VDLAGRNCPARADAELKLERYAPGGWMGRREGFDVVTEATEQSYLPTINERLLAEKLGALETAVPGSEELLRTLDCFIRTAADDALVRINPVRFAKHHGLPAEAVIKVFLHAREAGLLTMEWQYVCPGCGEIVERLTSLTSASAHTYCQICSAERDADLSDFIEVTFSVVPEIRRSSYHEPWSLDPQEHFLGYRFTQSAVVGDGSPLRDHLRDSAALYAYVDPGATETFPVTAKPGYLWLTNGPALLVRDDWTEECRSFAFEYQGARSKGFRAEIAAGPVQIRFTNATDARYALMIVRLTDHYDVRMTSFLSGSELISNQAFRELFPSETLRSGEGLAVQRLALLFTDIQGSTALYERIGDMRAFELVRLHFGYLRECISQHSGALVKTIGDAVMASFVDPVDALRAALDMQERIARFNADAGSRLIGLKIGLHSGACLAVTLNDRLDYFGQTVNIAARIQALSDADEIIVTEDVMSRPGAMELVAALQARSTVVQLKGVQGDVRVFSLRPTGTWSG
jgi:class 3 adenylate cyclase